MIDKKKKRSEASLFNLLLEVVSEISDLLTNFWEETKDDDKRKNDEVEECKEFLSRDKFQSGKSTNRENRVQFDCFKNCNQRGIHEGKLEDRVRKEKRIQQNRQKSK